MSSETPGAARSGVGADQVDAQALLSAVEANADELADALVENTDRVVAREEFEAERKKREQAEQRVEKLEQRLEADAIARTKAVKKRVERNEGRVAELQSRSLEKNAHLRADNVEPEWLEVAGEKVEYIKKDAGEFVRLTGAADPLERGGATRLSHGDLLPVQQLAQMDNDMLHSSAGSRPVRLAAEAWRERDDGDLWRDGCGKVRQYVDAGELATWIRVRETGVSKEYSQKLARRTIEAMNDLTKGRTYAQMKNRRKDGLAYKERRLVLPKSSDIPGETGRADASDADAPATVGVGGG